MSSGETLYNFNIFSDAEVYKFRLSQHSSESEQYFLLKVIWCLIYIEQTPMKESEVCQGELPPLKSATHWLDIGHHKKIENKAKAAGYLYQFLDKNKVSSLKELSEHLSCRNNWKLEKSNCSLLIDDKIEIKYEL